MVADLPDPAPGVDPDKQAAVSAEANLTDEVEKVMESTRLGTVPELPGDTSNDDARMSRYLKALKRPGLSRHQKTNILQYTHQLLRRMARLHQV